MIEVKESYRTQREAGIHWAPWRDNADIERAVGAVIGIFIVAAGTILVMTICAGLLRALGGAA